MYVCVYALILATLIYIWLRCYICAAEIICGVSCNSVWIENWLRCYRCADLLE